MSDVGLPDRLDTKYITCVTINGTPYPPVIPPGATPSYAQAVLSISTFVGGGGVVTLPFSTLTLNTADFALSNLNTAITYNGLQPAVFLVTAQVALDTTSGGTHIAILQLVKNGNVVPDSATHQTINQNGEAAVHMSRLMLLSPLDNLSVQLVSTDANMHAMAYPPIVGPPATAAEPAMIFTAYRVG